MFQPTIIPFNTTINKPFNENDNEDVFEFENRECFLLYIEKIYEGFDYDANVRSDFANQILYSLGKNDKEPFKVKVVPRKPFPEPRQKND